MNKYEQDMYIDEDALDMECLEQPALTVRYSVMLSDAKRIRDQAKEAMELTFAELDLKVREDPDEYNLPKITEGAVKSTILMQTEYKRAQKLYHNANHEVNVLNGVMEAIGHRKAMIEGLIKLHGQNYFAGPNIPHDLGELRKQREQKIQTGINKSLRRKRNG